MQRNKYIKVCAVLFIFLSTILLTKLIKDDREGNVKGSHNETRLLKVNDFGANGSDQKDDTKAVAKALRELKDGDTLFFPNGNYILSGESLGLLQNNIQITGKGTIITEEGFQIKGSNVTISNLSFKAAKYKIGSSAISAIAKNDDQINDIRIENVNFEGFFYSVFLKTESDNTKSIHNVSITNSKSVAPIGKNSGHFQSIGVHNITIMGCHTYNGQNATSYNFFKPNGYIKVIGNYDHNNSYGSLEIENGGKDAVVTGNTFQSHLWIDDSENVLISNNIVNSKILLTVETMDTSNILISGNITGKIVLDTFGENYIKGKYIKDVTIEGNRLVGKDGYGIFINGNYSKSVNVLNNDLSGNNYTKGNIGVIRSKTLQLKIIGNIMNGNVVLSSTGNEILEKGNIY